MTESKENNVIVVDATKFEAQQQREEGERDKRSGRNFLKAGMVFSALATIGGLVSIGAHFSKDGTYLKKNRSNIDALSMTSLGAGSLLGVLGYAKTEIASLKIDQANFKMKYLAEKVNKQVTLQEGVSQER